MHESYLFKANIKSQKKNQDNSENKKKPSEKEKQITRKDQE